MTDISSSSFEQLFDLRERQLRRAYKLGVLHGINAQSMAQVKNDVMSFDDYGWNLNE